MATIVNTRDKILKSAAVRVEPVTLPPNVIVPAGQVPGLPALTLNSKVIFLRSTSQIFQISKVNGQASPASITFEPVIRNVSGNLVWNVISGTATLREGPDGTKTLAFADMASDSASVRLTVTEGGITYSDTITVVKLREGADTVNVIMSNESHTIPADGNGLPTSYSGASTTISIFVGTVDTTELWSLSKTDSIGITSSLSGNTLSITEMQAAYSGAYVDIRAARAGFEVINKRFTVAKAKSGTSGTNGRPGEDGRRGSLTAYASGSSWSDATANSAISAAGGGGIKVIGDTVTISSSSFAATKYWSGGSWVDPGVVIDGNLLVNGTLSATKVYGGTLSGVSMNISGNFIVNGATGMSQLYTANLTRCTGSNGDAPGLAAFTPRSYGTGDAVNAIGIGTRARMGLNGGHDFYAAGTGTYGPFTGAHDGIVPNDSTAMPGDLMVDVTCIGQEGMSNSIFLMEPSSKPYQRGVRGPLSAVVGALKDFAPSAMVEGDMVVEAEGSIQILDIMSGAYYEMGETHTLVTVNGVGEGMIKVCGEGGPIGPDDLLVSSSTRGAAMRQDDDLVRGYTVAKARVNAGQQVTFADPGEVKLIPCIYLGG